MSRRSLMIGLLAIAACLGWQSDSQAQPLRQQRLLRWLGNGFGDGYQRCDPGYRTDYYSPYSAHNTMRVSETPEFDRLSYSRNYAFDQGQPLRFFQGVPFSVYAAPQGPDWMAPGEADPVPDSDNDFEALPAPEELPAPQPGSLEADHETAAAIPLLNGTGRPAGPAVFGGDSTRMLPAGFARRGKVNPAPAGK